MGSNKTDVAPMKEQGKPVLPTVGRIVHYVATEAVIVDAAGEKHPDIRAMLISGVFEQADGKPFVTGQIFRNGPGDLPFVHHTTEATGVEYDQTDFKVGTWHWPACV